MLRFEVFNTDLPDSVCKVFEYCTSAMLGGSQVVNKVAANDFDVFVHQYDIDNFNTARFGFRQLQQGDAKYDEIDHQRLFNVYEKLGTDGEKKVNVIVVGAVYWPAYIGAIYAMKANPELYQTRDERIKLHKDLCIAAGALAKGNV